MPRTWRKEPVKSGGGVSWRLIAGRAGDRVRLNLSRVTEGQAEAACIAMQAAEADGTALRVLALAHRDAEGAVRHLISDAAEARFLPEDAVDHGAMTVTEYFDRVFWPVRVDPGSPIGVAPSTAEAELGYWRHKGGRNGLAERRGILDGEIGPTRLRDLSDQQWERWQESNPGLSGRAKVLRRNAYAVMLAWARRQGHTTFRPEFFRIRGSTKRTRVQSDPLDVDEVRRLLEAAGVDDVPLRGATHRAMWAVGVGQGLRPGELVRVEWSDVDWTAHILQVRGTKTEESAAPIPMTPLAHRELQALWVLLGKPKAGRCFLYHRDRDPAKERKKPTKGPQPFTEYKKALEADALAAGIARKVTPYLLRHSFATLAWSLGIPQDTARRVMRHCDLKMLDRVYTRPRPAELVARVAGFDVG
jgi:integrase